MIPWPFPRRVALPAAEPVQIAHELPEPVDLARFDTFTADEVRALPKRLRRAVVADRKRRVTAALVRVVAGKAMEW